MADIHKYTSKEVLNKVLLDSSGDAVNAFSHTTSEALNAALDDTNSRLNVSLEGGTIGGDVTISGDLTVTGSSTYSYTEAISGTGTAKANFDILTLTNAVSAADMDGTETSVLFNQYYYDASTPAVADAGRISIGTETDWTGVALTQDSYMAFETALNGTVTEYMRITSAGNVGIGTTAPTVAKLEIHGGSYNTSLLIKGSGSETGIKFVDSGGTVDGYMYVTGGEMAFLNGSGAYTLKVDTNSRISLSNNDSGDYNTVFGNDVGDPVSGQDHNTFIGHNVAATGTMTADADYNTGVGAWSLNDLTSGASNTGLGYDSLAKLTTGGYNVAMGSGAGDALTTQSNCVLVGMNAGTSINHNDANGTTIVGRDAGEKLTSGIGTTALGYGALTGNHTGDYNTAIGYESAKGVTDNAHSNNTSVGYQSLKSVTTGYSNVVIGASAADAVTTMANSIAIGKDAMGACPSGQAIDGAIAIGTGAMAGSGSTTSAIGPCVAVGADALKLLTIGQGNIAVGYASLDANLVGSYNTAVGHESLSSFVADADNHGQNTAVGYRAGKFLSTGTYNTFYGSGAGQGIDGTKLTGDSNTAIGQDSGILLQGAAHENTFVGQGSGDVVTTGSDNTCIGFGADTDDATAVNQSVIGHSTTGQADNSVTLGNSAVTKIYMSQDADGEMYANGTINTSDVRFKKDIEDSDLGLSFINSVRPVKYKFKNEKNSDKTKYGIIAQEVIDVLKSSGNEDFDGIRDSDKDRLGADYVQFIAPLIKAVQELSAKVEALENK